MGEGGGLWARISQFTACMMGSGCPFLCHSTSWAIFQSRTISLYIAPGAFISQGWFRVFRHSISQFFLDSWIPFTSSLSSSWSRDLLKWYRLLCIQLSRYGGTVALSRLSSRPSQGIESKAFAMSNSIMQSWSFRSKVLVQASPVLLPGLDPHWFGASSSLASSHICRPSWYILDTIRQARVGTISLLCVPSSLGIMTRFMTRFESPVLNISATWSISLLIRFMSYFNSFCPFAFVTSSVCQLGTTAYSKAIRRVLDL